MNEDELNELTVYQLKNLARYYDLQFPVRIRKQDLIDLIIGLQRQKREENIPQMSARVRRLQELNRSE